MIAGLIGALLIGLSLGLLGSGGSILTVPVLKYLLHHEDKAAMAESLVIVGSIALLGSIPFMVQRRIHWASVVCFGIPGTIGSYVGAWSAAWLRGPVLLIIFAMLMLTAAVIMLRPIRLDEAPTQPRRRASIALDGLIVGVVTGMVGAGGGFLIIPALVLLGGLPMHTAVGTSLLVIAIKGTSFVTHAGMPGINWKVVGLFTVMGALGSLAGNQIGGWLPQRRLRQGFGLMLILMAASMLVTEVSRLMN